VVVDGVCRIEIVCLFEFLVVDVDGDDCGCVCYAGFCDCCAVYFVVVDDGDGVFLVDAVGVDGCVEVCYDVVFE